MPPQRDWLEKDFYAVLGVSKDASQEDIKKAYRRLARENHPDANPDDPKAEQRFKEIGEAYAVLGDSKSRKEYDEIRRLGAAGLGGFGPGAGGPGFSGGFAGGDLGDLLRNIFSDAGGAGGFRTGGFGGRRARPQKGQDLEAEVHLEFADALSGVRTKLRVTGDGTCDNCGGSGAAPGSSPVVCPTCSGSGQVTVDQGPFSIANPCPTCAGRGQVVETPCGVCGGAGRVVRPRELTVAIPAGVKDGATIRVPGRGGPGANGGPAGDVFVRVRVEPHPLFGRRGDDITVEVPVTYAEAVLGTKLAVPTPQGDTRTIKIPAGTASGRTFRIRGEGAPSNGRSGDLLVTVRVEVPDKLSKEQKRLIKELAEHDDTSARERLFAGGSS